MTVPALDLYFKDHKDWTEGQGDPPPFRPVVKASSAVNVHLSDVVSEIIEPLATAMKGTYEKISTNDFLSCCNSYNEKLQKKTEGIKEPTSKENESNLSKKKMAGNSTKTPSKLEAINKAIIQINYTDQPNKDNESKSSTSNNLTLPANMQQHERPVVVVGADAVNMYPSLKEENSARAAKRAMLTTDLKFDGVNYKAAALYVLCSPGNQ